ncbi:DUF648 domain-containing protein [Chlamydia serpentis]|nr:DUF648 domain-containing protein [Chlamydia serpentis]
MLIYSFDSSVPLTFLQCLMAKLDNWFFFGGHRLKIIRVEDSKLAYIRENIAISLIEKILKILTFLLVPIVLIALIIRYFLHAKFVNKLKLFSDVPRSDVSRARISTKCTRIGTIASYDFMFSGLSAVIFSDNEIPKTCRLENYVKDGQFFEGNTGKKKYLSNMLTHVISCLKSVDQDKSLKKIVSKSGEFGALPSSSSSQWKRFSSVSSDVQAIMNTIGQQPVWLREHPPTVLGEFLKVYWQRYLAFINTEDFKNNLINQVIEESLNFCPNAIKNIQLLDEVDLECRNHLVEALFNRPGNKFTWKDFTFSVHGKQARFMFRIPTKNK